MSNLFYLDIANHKDNAYFTDTIRSLSEPWDLYHSSGLTYWVGTMCRKLRSANEDSLRNINRWYTPYYTSTVRVHYTLYNPDSVWARFQQYDILDESSTLRTDPKLMDKIFGIGYQKGTPGYELKADTLESYQVKYYDLTCGNVIKGWQDCLQHMHIGDSWLILVPWYLAYGQSGSGTIKPYTNLFFRLELVDITSLGDNIETK